MPLGEALLARSRFCLVSDLDWTMVDHKDASHEKLLRFNRLWQTRFAQDSLLVFSTGRSPQLFHTLAVCSVGTEILIGGQADAEWAAHLEEGWDRERAAAVAGRFPELVLQEVSEQRAHKVSYKLYATGAAQAAGVVSNLRASLAATGLAASVVFSGGEDLDILPGRASKGKALAFLLQQMEGGGRGGGGGWAAGREVLVCGDSGNDVELFAVPGVHGCVVANAHAELREWCAANGHDRVFEATRDGPGGICQALHHFGFVRSPEALGGAFQRRQAVVGLHEAFEEWFNATDDSAPAQTDDEDDGGGADQGARRAAPELLEEALGEGFELIGPGGSVTSGPDLLHWFRTQGRGSRALQAGAAAHADDPLALRVSLLGRISAGGRSSVPTSPHSASTVGEAFEERGGGGGGRYRIWIDRYSEREVAAGVWIVRYMEVQQRFAAAAEGQGGERRGRWSSAVLKEAGGGGGAARYQWCHVHECWVPTGEARA